PRGRHRRGADQDGEREPHRPRGQVQPAAPHRGRARLARDLSRQDAVGRLTRLLLPAAVLLAGYYAVFGGEHSIMDLRRTRAARAAELVELGRVRAQNDSLRSLVDSLEHDPAMLERLARERFGLIRDGEVLYR